MQVTPNLYGNIVANVVAGLTGGPGIMPGANVGNQVAVFEQGARHVGQDVSLLYTFASQCYTLALHQVAERVISSN